MEDVQLNPNGQVQINMAYGSLKLNVEPVRLYKFNIPENAKVMLDRIIETEYKVLLEKVKPIMNYTSEERERVKELNEPIQEVLDIATFTRNILPLHTDSEMIPLSKEEENIIEVTYNIWKYSYVYGFQPSKTIV